MGLMMGKVEGNTMIVMDSFALPVEGTETRVNAATEGKILVSFVLAHSLIGYEYMVEYLNLIKQVIIVCATSLEMFNTPTFC